MSDAEEASTRRTFLEVTLPNAETTKLLQLDSHVKFKNVLKMIKMPPGRLLFDDGFVVDPLDTPLSLGLPTGVDNVVQVEYVLDGDHFSPMEQYGAPSGTSDQPANRQGQSAGDAATGGYISGAEMFGNDIKKEHPSLSRTQPAESRLHSLASTSRPVPSPSVPAELHETPSKVRISPSRDGDDDQPDARGTEAIIAKGGPDRAKITRTPSQDSEVAPMERPAEPHPNGKWPTISASDPVKNMAEKKDLSPQTPVLREVRRERVHRAPVLAPGVDGPSHAGSKLGSRSPDHRQSQPEHRRDLTISTHAVRGGPAVGAQSQRAASSHSSVSASMPSEHGRRMYQQLMRNNSIGPPGNVNNSDAPGANMPLSARAPLNRCALLQTHALRENADLVPWPANSSYVKRASGSQSMALPYGPAQPLPPPLPKSQAQIQLQRDLSKADSRALSASSAGMQSRPSAVGAAATHSTPPPPPLSSASEAPQPSLPATAAAATTNNYYHYYYGAQGAPSHERTSFSHPGNNSGYFMSTQPEPAPPQSQQQQQHDIVTPMRVPAEASFQGNTPSVITPGTDVLDIQALKAVAAAAAAGNGQLTLLTSPPQSVRDHHNFSATQGYTNEQLAPFAKEVDDIRHGLAKEKQQRRELSKRVQALVESVSVSSNRVEIGTLAQQLHANQMERLREQRRRARGQSASASSTPRRAN